jgi:hypothetical protein
MIQRRLFREREGYTHLPVKNMDETRANTMVLTDLSKALQAVYF